MTRETKVGLLVGLAFIIVVGILLTDYNRVNPEPAPLTAVNGDVNKGAATPHNGSSHDEVIPPPAAPAPVHEIPTPQELHDRVNRIANGPATGNPGIPPRGHGPVAIDDLDKRPFYPSDDHAGPADDNDLQKVARQNGEDLVKVDGHNNNSTKMNANNSNTNTVNGADQYTAVSGDTLSRLAGRFLGRNTKANQAAIIAVNPSLKANPNNIIAGKTYMIPPRPSASSSAPATPSEPTQSAPVVADNTPADTAGGFYTVKDNDNLWRIAEEELGDATQWTRIRDMNQDVLKGGSAVRKNMKLRMPKRAVASTN